MTDDSDPTAGGLDRLASSYTISAGDVSGVVSRARRRSARRRSALAGLSAVAVLAAGVTAVRTIESDDDLRIGMAEGSRNGDVGIEWRQIDVRSGLGIASVAGEGPLYALSTAAGERDMAKARRNGTVWHSDDGVEWTAVGKLTDDLYLSDLSARDDRIYAIGTAPSTARVTTGRRASDVLVGWSDDRAATWRRTPLPIDMAAIASKATSVNVMQPDIAAGPKGTVVILRVTAELDVPRLLPDGATAPHGWAVSASGVDVLGPPRQNPCPAGMTLHRGDQPDAAGDRGRTPPQRIHSVWCFDGDGNERAVRPQDAHGVTATYSFGDLGVVGDAVDAVLGEPMLFAAGPGSTEFRRAEAPPVGAMSAAHIDADDAGFSVAIATYDEAKDPQQSRVLLLRSEDGLEWATVNEVSRGSTWATALGRLDGVTSVIASGEGGGVLLRDDGRGGWTSLDLGQVVDPDAADGRRVHAVVGDIGPFGAVVVVALEPLRPGAPEAAEREQPMYRLLVSRDGVTWQDDPVEPLIGGRGAGASRVVVRDADAVVTLGRLPAEGNGKLQQVTVVAAAR